jgi:AcrR family transcriptional regulator
MVERTNRRDAIIGVASRLFVEQGYAATSVRQIAEAVGCTEAALYYHFKNGKRELLQAVVACNIPDLIHAIEECSPAQTLHDFIDCFMHRLANKARKHMDSQIRWIMAEFPNFSHEERVTLYEKHAVFRSALLAQIKRFVADEVEAEHLAWMLVFLSFGYGQLMINLDLQSAVEFDLDAYIGFAAKQIAAGHE